MPELPKTRSPRIMRRLLRDLAEDDGGVVIVGGEADVQNVLFDVVGVDVKW